MQTTPASTAPEAHPEIEYTLFTIVAYRWGWTNNHQYTVGVEVELNRAILRARQANDHRGGKYGVAVYGWSAPSSSLDLDGDLIDQQRSLLNYFPSTYQEKEPFDNPRLEMFSSIGHAAHETATSGLMCVSTDQDISQLGEPVFNARSELYAVVVPQQAWLRHMVREAEHNSRLMFMVQNRIKNRVNEPFVAGAALSDEDKAWMEQANESIAKDLETLFDRADKLFAERNAKPLSNID